MYWIPCQKRRSIVKRHRDGSKEQIYRCAHGAAPTYKQVVDEDECKACTMRNPLIQIAKCSPKPPSNPDYAPPKYGEFGELIFVRVAGKEPPPEPEGYRRRISNPWVFESLWPDCPKRHFQNDLMPNGMLKVRPYCEILHKEIDIDTCTKCVADMGDVNASLDEDVVMIREDEVEYPAMGELVNNYWQAVKNWIKAGRPKRTEAEVKKIHDVYCSKCDWYDKDARRCKGCGCKVTPQGGALLNKIKMATENCPRKFW